MLGITPLQITSAQLLCGPELQIIQTVIVSGLRAVASLTSSKSILIPVVYTGRGTGAQPQDMPAL